MQEGSVLGREQYTSDTMCADTWIRQQVWHSCRTISHSTWPELTKVKGEAGEGGRAQISRERLHRAGGGTKALRNGSFLNR